MPAPWKVWSTHLRLSFRMISAASCYGRMQDRAPFLAWGSTISFGTIPAKEQGSSAVEARRANSVIDASRHDGGQLKVFDPIQIPTTGYLSIISHDRGGIIRGMIQTGPHLWYGANRIVWHDTSRIDYRSDASGCQDTNDSAAASVTDSSCPRRCRSRRPASI
jgi:hypothetical protein